MITTVCSWNRRNSDPICTDATVCLDIYALLEFGRVDGDDSSYARIEQQLRSGLPANKQGQRRHLNYMLQTDGISSKWWDISRAEVVRTIAPHSPTKH